jgi:predicted transposase YbfD/YdcC
MSTDLDMNEAWFQDWEEYFSEVEDPRIDRRKLHPLMDVIALSLCAILSGAEGWVDVEAFGKLRQEWLSQFLTLPHGIPSHDTIGRLFSLIKPSQFQKCFLNWARKISDLDEDLISLDGKALRGSNNFGDSPVTIVSAWSAKNKIVIGQVKTDQKSNEITALPELIDSLDLSNSIVSIDAAGCQKNIAKKIVESNADYILALKGNQGNLRKEVEGFLSGIQDDNVYGKNIDRCESTEKSHGRIEKRVCVVSNDTHLLPITRDWEKLRSVVMIASTRVIHGEVQTERRYYISSAQKSAEEFLEKTRGHWGVENSLHWVLDVIFREDQCRVRAGYAAENFATLRHIALNLLKKNQKVRKGSIRSKRLRAGWDKNFLLELFRGF